MSHPNRNWKRRWIVDAAKKEARHEGGLVVSFAEYGQGAAVNTQAIYEALEKEFPGHGGSRLAKLLEQARRIYAESR